MAMLTIARLASPRAPRLRGSQIARSADPPSASATQAPAPAPGRAESRGSAFAETRDIGLIAETRDFERKHASQLRSLRATRGNAR